MDCSTPGFRVQHQIPGACSNSCSLSWWCHPTISSSVIPYLCFQFFPASWSCLMSQFFASSGQSVGASVLPVNIQGWFPLGLTGLISLQSKGISVLQHHNLKAPILGKSDLFLDEPTNSYMTTSKKKKKKKVALTIWIFVSKETSLFFNTLSRFVKAFLPRNKS